MTTTQRSTVVGVFRERDEARDAIEALKDAGFNANEISILSPDKEQSRAMAEETGTQAGSGAATGAVAGGILGGIGGWLVGIGALAIPGVGPFIAAGAFATALGGAAIGAGVGAIAGALAGMGVPEDEARYYEGEVKSGRTLVTVRTTDRYDEAQQLLRRYGAYDIETGDGRVRQAEYATTAVDNDDVVIRSDADAARQKIELRAEELQARKSTVETGQVTVGTEVVEQERTIEVPVTREEVYVERRSVDRVADEPIDRASERTIEVPVREEHVEIEKRPVVYEEVLVGKEQVHSTQQVSDTVRHEEARIERVGDVRVSGATAGDDLTTSYVREMRANPRYRGRSWTEIESDAERDWTTRNPGTPWARARDAIRRSWDDASR